MPDGDIYMTVTLGESLVPTFLSGGQLGRGADDTHGRGITGRVATPLRAGRGGGAQEGVGRLNRGTNGRIA
jgi:hypothetical protein